MAPSQGKLVFSPKVAEYTAPKIEAELDEIQALDRDAALLHQAIRDAVDEVGAKNASWALQRDGSTLSNWINERPDANGIARLPPAKLVLWLGKKQPSGRLAALVNRLWGFAPPVKTSELTPEEENKRLKAQLRAEGSFGAHVLEKALGSTK